MARRAFAALLLAALLPAGPAAAHYVGLGGNLIFVEDATYDSQQANLEALFEGGLGLSVFAGLHLPNDIRLEADIAYRSAPFETIKIANDRGIGVRLGEGDLSDRALDASGTTSLLSGMVSAYYDFPTEVRLSPYVGAGLGLALLSSELEALGKTVIDDSDVILAYQLAVGASYKTAPNIRVFGGYRYLATQNAELGDFAGFEVEAEFEAHLLELGLRFAF